jgi:hypothetical protein
MSQAVDTFVERNQPRLLDELLDFLRIPSVSTLPEHKPDIEKAAEFVAESLRRAGIRWANGGILPLSRPFATATFTRADRPTTRVKCTCTSRPWRPCERSTVRCR